jgi:hypothetical protein
VGGNRSKQPGASHGSFWAVDEGFSVVPSSMRLESHSRSVRQRGAALHLELESSDERITDRNFSTKNLTTSKGHGSIQRVYMSIKVYIYYNQDMALDHAHGIPCSPHIGDSKFAISIADYDTSQICFIDRREPSSHARGQSNQGKPTEFASTHEMRL